MLVLGLSLLCSRSSFLFTSFSSNLCFLGKGECQLCQTWTQTVQLALENACGFFLVFLAESHMWLCSCYYNQTLEDVFFINLFFMCLLVSLLAHSSSRVSRARHPYFFSVLVRTFWLHTRIVSDLIDGKGPVGARENTLVWQLRQPRRSEARQVLMRMDQILTGNTVIFSEGGEPVN